MLRARAPRRYRDRAPLDLEARLCSGSRRVLARARGWPTATAIIVVRDPGGKHGEARTMLVDDDGESVAGAEISPEVLLEPEAALPQPLRHGSRVSLLGAVSAGSAGASPDYASARSAAPC
jgi:hypothetical protein